MEKAKEIVICYPSYRRIRPVKTLELIPSAKGFVSQSQIRGYRRHNRGHDFIPIPDKVQGNLPRVKNWILNYWYGKNKIVCLIDDDLHVIGYFENGARHKCNESEIYAMIAKYSQLAIDLGIRFWGINVNCDAQCYRTYKPFSFAHYVGGPFGVFIDLELRYDERIFLKEDYDLTLQVLNIYRKLLRVNRFYYICDQQTLPGGCACYRNSVKEKEHNSMLQKKWGSEVVTFDSLVSSRSKNRWGKKIRTLDINPILRVPIKGG